jgi:hypothetical protein
MKKLSILAMASLASLVSFVFVVPQAKLLASYDVNDLTSLQDAFSAIKSGSLGGDVTINIKQDISSEENVLLSLWAANPSTTKITIEGNKKTLQQITFPVLKKTNITFSNLIFSNCFSSSGGGPSWL